MANLEYTNVFDSNYGIDTCSKCGTETYIINRTHHICENCNSWRLHGKSLIDLRREKQKAYRINQLKKSKAKAEKLKEQGIKKHVPKIRQVSEKQKQINEQLKKVKDKITEDAINTNNYYCHSCGCVNLNLDRSHRISVKQRPDLQCDPLNIKLECRKCHQNYESGDWSKMILSNCIVEDLHYIFLNDSERFNKLLFKLLDYYSKNPHKDVAKLLKKIEAFEQIEVF